MRKNILISIFFILTLITLVIMYLSFFGIKTNSLNNFINEKVKEYDSRIFLNLNEVYLKLNLKEKSVKINLNDVNVNFGKEYINLTSLNINMDLLKFLRKKKSIKIIRIETSENTLKNVTNFFNSYKFNISRTIAFSQIQEGNIKALANIYFENDSSNFLYEVKGYVKDAKINLIGSSKINKLNFNFDVKNKKYNLGNISFEHQKIKYTSKKINIVNLNENFEVTGDLINKKGLLDPHSLSKIFNINLNILGKTKIVAETKNTFSFKVKSNNLVKDIKLKSDIKFDEIFINRKYQDLIYLNNGIIRAEYLNNNLSINVLSKFTFFENKNNKKNKINLNITKKKKENFKIEGDLKNEAISINVKNLLDLLKIKFNILPSNKVLIESDNQFAFELDKDQKVKDLTVNSSLNFDKLHLGDKFENLIYLNDGKIETSVKDKNLRIKLDSRYSFYKEKNINSKKNNFIKINIIKDKNKDTNVETFFNADKIKLNPNEFVKYLNIRNDLVKDQIIELNSNNKINFIINNKNRIENLKVKSNLKFDKLKINYRLNQLKKLIPDFNNEIYLIGDNFEIDYSKDKFKIQGDGKYILKNKPENFKINILNKKQLYEFETSFNLNSFLINIDQINYLKEEDVVSNIKLKGKYLKNKNLFIKEIKFLENNNKIFVSNLNLAKNFKIKNFDNLEFYYLNNKKKPNDIKIIKNKKNFELISKNYDGRLLVESLLKSDSNNNFLKIFKNLNSEIDLSIDKFYLGNKSYLENINGKFLIKENKFNYGNIDATLNRTNKFTYNFKTKPNNEKITKLYIEQPEPFIKNYKFIKGFEKGLLNFDSSKIGGISKSKLKIYDFKVKEVPLLAKILTLASLQGIADILTGEGIRFDEFEMDYIKKNKDTTTIEEMYAIGPAISMLMEGYIVKDELTSLRGTLVPATTINKSIKKIPLIGNILVGKKVGEGVFGVSFKIKGHPKDLKTTVNPVKTLTPRFITRTLEKLKKN